MPDYNLNIITDASQVVNAFTKAENGIKDVKNATSDFSNNAKAAFTSATTQAASFSSEIKAGSSRTKDLNGGIGKLGSGVQTIRKLRQELNIYVADAEAAGKHTDEWRESLEKAAKTKEKIVELQFVLGGIANNEAKSLTSAFGVVAKTGVEGFEAVVSAEALFGEKNKDIEEQLVKLNALNTLANLAGEFALVKEKVTQFKVAFTPVTDLYTRVNNAVKNFGKQSSDSTKLASDGSKNLFSSLINGTQSFVKSGISGVKSFFAVLAENPFGIILFAIGSLITATVLLKDKIKPLGVLFDAIATTVKFLLAPLVKLAELTGIIADENERRTKATIENSKDEVDAIEKLYDYEIKLAEAAQKKTSDLENKKYNATKQRLIKTLVALEMQKILNKKLSDDEISSQEDTKKKLIEIYRERNIQLAKEESDRRKTSSDFYKITSKANIDTITNDQQKEIALAKANTSDKLKELKNSFDKESALSDVEYNAYYHAQDAVIAEGEKTISDINKKYYDKAFEEKKKQNEKLKQLQQDLINALMDLDKKSAQAIISQSNDEAKIEAEKQQSLAELKILRDSILKKGQAEADYEAEIHKRKAVAYKFTIDQEQEFANIEQSIFAVSSKKLIQLNVDRENEKAKINSLNAKNAEQNLKAQEEAQIASAEATQRPVNLTQDQRADFELEVQNKILNIQKDFAEKQLDLKLKSLNAQNAEEVKSLNGRLALIPEEEAAKRDQIITELESLQGKYSSENDLAVASTDKLINDINNKLEDNNKKLKTFNLAKAMGLSQADTQNLQTALNEATQAFDSFTQSEIADVDKQIQASQDKQNQYDSEIQSLQSQLNQEQQLRDQGKANNTDRINAEIAEKQNQKIQEAQIEEQDLIRKKQLQKQQLLIDSLSQASGLITSSVNIFAQATAEGGPLGVPIALAAISAMLIGFATSKALALKSINEGNNFAEGIIGIKGPGTSTSDSIPANLSAGESVISAKNTKKHKDLLLGIHNNDNALIKIGVQDLIKNTGITLSNDLPAMLLNKKAAIKEAELNQFINIDNSKIEKQMGEMKSILSLILHENKQKIFSDGTGNVFLKSNNHTKMIRKNT